MPSVTTENYLKAICVLADRHPDDSLVRLGELAAELSVTPGTITTMIRSLADRGLVDYQQRLGVRLTSKGKAEALRVLRRHRMIELFLVKVMKMDWSEVHADAEALEHAVSDRLIDKMDEMMGYPSRDPHGDPIPAAGEDLPAVPGLPLSEAEPGKYRVSQVNDQDPGFLIWLAEADLRPGTPLKVHELDRRSGVLTLSLRGRGDSLAIGLDAARAIRVEPVG